MEKFLKSRTVLTIVILFGLTAIQVYQGVLEPNLYLLLSGFLSALAVYFRINVKVK